MDYGRMPLGSSELQFSVCHAQLVGQLAWIENLNIRKDRWVIFIRIV
jgi:hypothetical protein